MMLLIVYEVFMRYVLHQPPMVADEFSAYMLVALAYIGMAFTWRRRGHVRITALTSRLPTKVSNWMRVITILLALACFLMLVQVSYNHTVYSFVRNVRSSTWVLTPLAWSHMTLLIGFIIMFLLLITELAKAIIRIRSGKSVEVDST